MKIALIGYGDLGRYIKSLLEDNQPIAEPDIAYFDDNLYNDGVTNAFPFNRYADKEFDDYSFYVCLGYKHLATKHKIITQLLALNRSVPHYIHPSSYVHPSVRVGHGSFIYPGCSIDRNVVIGNGTWIANADIIAHDCKIGDCCWFGASVTLSGKVKIQDQTFIGTGTNVANDVTVGSNVVIGMGTCITRSVADGCNVIGNPMKILDKKINLS